MAWKALGTGFRFKNYREGGNAAKPHFLPPYNLHSRT